MIKKLTKINTQQLNQILDIWLNSNIEAHNFISRNYWITNYDFVRTALPKADIYVACQNNEIIGFLGLDKNYIAGIFVKKEARDRGVGRKLLAKAKEEKNELALSVYEKNQKALSFYKHNGFVFKSKYTEDETRQIAYKLLWKGTNI